MYPHERSLVKKLAGKPFVILGVNSDSKDRLRKLLKKKTVTWRSWWDGGNPSGPIARAWGVRGWPTLYLIDHKGIIRQEYLGSPRASALDAAIDGLVREAKKEATNEDDPER